MKLYLRFAVKIAIGWGSAVDSEQAETTTKNLECLCGGVWWLRVECVPPGVSFWHKSTPRLTGDYRAGTPLNHRCTNAWPASPTLRRHWYSGGLFGEWWHSFRSTLACGTRITWREAMWTEHPLVRSSLCLYCSSSRPRAHWTHSTSWKLLSSFWMYTQQNKAHSNVWFPENSHKLCLIFKAGLGPWCVVVEAACLESRRGSSPTLTYRF